MYGICSRLFCDFGDEFEVLDTTGEEPKEIFISNITQVRDRSCCAASAFFVMTRYWLCDQAELKTGGIAEVNKVHWFLFLPQNQSVMMS